MQLFGLRAPDVILAHVVVGSIVFIREHLDIRVVSWTFCFPEIVELWISLATKHTYGMGCRFIATDKNHVKLAR